MLGVTRSPQRFFALSETLFPAKMAFFKTPYLTATAISARNSENSRQMSDNVM
ncbi:hypothetical protein YERSI8AC_10136 [Enterobacterales bacterium 8AC]|nr:hypothetical protein YERSI8AC_10136 [Enterobacterales bacterium 8AC]